VIVFFVDSCVLRGYIMAESRRTGSYDDLSGKCPSVEFQAAGARKPFPSLALRAGMDSSPRLTECLGSSLNSDLGYIMAEHDGYVAAASGGGTAGGSRMFRLHGPGASLALRAGMDSSPRLTECLGSSLNSDLGYIMAEHDGYVAAAGGGGAERRANGSRSVPDILARRLAGASGWYGFIHAAHEVFRLH
jgi:hypothetical protein